jgi:hypothetical protein
MLASFSLMAKRSIRASTTGLNIFWHLTALFLRSDFERRPFAILSMADIET